MLVGKLETTLNDHSYNQYGYKRTVIIIDQHFCENYNLHNMNNILKDYVIYHDLRNNVTKEWEFWYIDCDDRITDIMYCPYCGKKLE